MIILLIILLLFLLFAVGYFTGGTEYIPIDFAGNILMIGFGAVAITTVPALFNHIKGLTSDRITIITADDRNEKIAEEYEIEHIISPITKENIEDIRRRIRGGDMIINLSVDVDSISLARIAQEVGCFYIDTCIEPWPDMYVHDNMEIRTNYYDRIKGLELREERISDQTVVFSMGANPGIISLLVKKGLTFMTGENPKSREGWAKLAKKTGVKIIQIAEQDTQKPNIPFNENTFMNTWSVDGFVSEAIHQPAECGFGTHEKSLPKGASTHSDISKFPQLNTKSSIYFDVPGGALYVKSWTPHGPFTGHMVTHNESISIAEYLTLEKNGTVNYRPTVYYAYKPIDDANKAIDVILKNDGKIQDTKIVLRNDQIESGFDELGALLICDSCATWYGSTVNNYDVHLPHSNATTMQVVGGIMVGIKWMLDNPKKGVIEADDIPAEYIDIAMPYLGHVYGRRAQNWSPGGTQLSDFIV